MATGENIWYNSRQGSASPLFGNNRPVPQALQDAIYNMPNESVMEQGLQNAATFASLFTNPFGVPATLGLYGEYPVTTTPTDKAKTLDAQDAKKMEIAKLLAARKTPKKTEARPSRKMGVPSTGNKRSPSMGKVVTPKTKKR